MDAHGTRGLGRHRGELLSSARSRPKADENEIARVGCSIDTQPTYRAEGIVLLHGFSALYQLTHFRLGRVATPRYPPLAFISPAMHLTTALPSHNKDQGCP